MIAAKLLPQWELPPGERPVLLRELPPIYWVGQSVRMVFLCKIKDTFFIFTDSFIDLDILSMSAISRMVLHCLFSINVSI